MLRNIIITIINLTILFSCLAHATQMNVERDYYQEGDEINVFYNIGKKEGDYLSYETLEGGNWSSMDSSETLERNETTFKLKATYVASWYGYQDYRFTLNDIEDFIRIRLKTIPAIPGAIHLFGGPEFNYGDPIIFEVNVPADKILLEPPLDPNPRYKVVYDILSLPVIGSSYGVPVDDEGWHGVKIEEANTKIDWTSHETKGAKFDPGFYRVRLVENHRTTVDSVDFTVIRKAAPGVLSFAEKEDFKVGDVPKFKINRNEYSSEKIWKNVSIHRIGDDGRLISSRPDLEHLDYNIENDIITGPKLETAGNYVLRLVTGYFRRYIGDQMTFRVAAKAEPAPEGQPFISIGDNPIKRQGDEITVTYYFSQKPARGQKINLYKKFEFDRVKRKEAREKDAEGQGDKKIKSWEPKIKKKHAFLLDEELAPGSYSIRFCSDLKGDWIYCNEADFKVVAPMNSAILDLGKKEFLWDEDIPVNITLPDGVSPNSEFLFLQLVKKGGYVPGCSIEADKVILYESLNGKTQHRLEIGTRSKALPGTYVLKLRDEGSRIKSYFTDAAPVIGQTEFKIITTRLNGAIGITPNTVFETGETIDVNIVVPESIPQESLIKMALVSNFLGYNAPGGSFIPARNYGSVLDIEWDGHRATVSTYAMHQGFWEFWLIKKRDITIVMDRVPYEVKHPDSPFNNEFGVWGGRPEYNLAQHNPFPPVGEYLTPETCGGPFSLEPLKEKMDISFVKWDNGNYVDVPEPIDFGAGFYVQGQLEDEASHDSYIVTLKTPEGDHQEVALFPLKDDPTIVRSDRLYLIWDPYEEDEISE